MDCFFDDLPCPSESDMKDRGLDEPNTAENSQNPLRGKSSSTNITEIEEQPTHSSIDDISRAIQDLVEKIHDSRTSDQKVMDSFQENLVQTVTEMFQQMKEHMYAVYENSNNTIQMKLQELSEVLERCTKLNEELLEAGQALASLKEGLAISQEPEL